MMVYNIDSINSFWIIISAKFPGTAHEHELTLFTPHDAKTVWVCRKVGLREGTFENHQVPLLGQKPSSAPLSGQGPWNTGRGRAGAQKWAGTGTTWCYYLNRTLVFIASAIVPSTSSKCSDHWSGDNASWTPKHIKEDKSKQACIS